MIKLETSQQVNRICFTICIVCIVLGAVLLFALIWMPQSETVTKGFLSSLVLFLASLLTVGVMRFFIGVSPSTNTGLPTPETHIMCPHCGQLVRRESDKCQHCQGKLIPQ